MIVNTSLLQGGSQDGARFCVKLFWDKISSRKKKKSRTIGHKMLTWAIFVFISTGSTTRRMPFASCLSFGFTEYDGSTWAPYSVDLMYDWIDLVVEILGILMLSIQQPDCGELFVCTYLFCKEDCAPSKERMCWLALAFFNRRDASLRSCWSCSSERSSSAMVH